MWLLIVRVPVFGLHVCFPSGRVVRGAPGCARVRTGSDRAGVVLLLSLGLLVLVRWVLAGR